MLSPAASTSAWRWAASNTSPGTGTTPSSPAAALWSASPPRASTTTVHPRSASAFVSASPSPREAPVTIPTMASAYDQPGTSRYGELVLVLWAEPHVEPDDRAGREAANLRQVAELVHDPQPAAAALAGEGALTPGERLVDAAGVRDLADERVRLAPDP